METWTRRTYVCDSSTCDAWLEITTKDSLVHRTTTICPCGNMPNLVSEDNATISQSNEKEQQVENQQLTKLDNNYQVEALEFKNGETIYHYLTKADINEMFRQRQFTDSFLATARSKISRIVQNLTSTSWYSDAVDKEDVLSDLCSILEHEPKATLTWSATITVEGSTDVNLNEVNEFDLRYFLNDELSVDTNHGDTEILTHFVDNIDSEDWS